MSPFTAVTLAAVGGVVAAWLAVCLLAPSSRRVAVEWLGTVCLYMALAAWFVGLALEARAEGRTLALIPFGFLAFLFCAGLCVSTWHTLAHLLGRAGDAESPTN